MIITCEQCQTRFKVADDKLAAGPVRMRCSKCNHVFSTGAPGPLTVPQLPLSVPQVPLSVPQPIPIPPMSGMFRAPTPRPAPMPNLEASASAFGIPRLASKPGLDPFAAVSDNARPTTKAWTSADPFANLGPAVATAPSPGDPFPSRSAPDPFARSAPDPFAGLRPSTPSQSKGLADPFAGLAKPADPFAGVMPAVDPFAAPTADPFPSAADPFGSFPPKAADPFASPSFFPSNPSDSVTPKPADPFAPKAADPFRSKPPVDSFSPPANADPFAALGGASSPFQRDLSPSAPTQGMANPFARSATSSAFSNAAMSDPFAAMAVAVAAPTLTPTPATVDDDPFASLGDDPRDPPDPPVSHSEGNAFFDGEARPALEAAPAASSPTLPPAVSERRAPSLPPVRAEVPAPSNGTATVLRSAAIVVQVALFSLFLLVAVVLGRGGNVDRLLALDIVGALGGPEAALPLMIEELRVSRRHLQAGFDVVVVSGVVVHNGDAPHAGVRVSASFDDGTQVTGWAWSAVDALAVASLANVEVVESLASRKPKSPTLSPGDHAPFVLIGRAPAVGSLATVTAVPE